MNYPYMPKSTALWLIENTALTFEQIGEFCGLHELEVKNIADAESNKMQGLNPIISGQVTREDIEKCEADPNARLTLREEIVAAQKKQNKKGVGYTPKLHRQNRLGGILWILKNYPVATLTIIYEMVLKTFIFVCIMSAKLGEMVCFNNRATAIISAHTMYNDGCAFFVVLCKFCNSL